MTKIRIKWDCNIPEGSETFTVGEIGFTEEEWSELDDASKEEHIIDFFYSLESPCYAIVDGYIEE